MQHCGEFVAFKQETNGPDSFRTVGTTIEPGWLPVMLTVVRLGDR